MLTPQEKHDQRVLKWMDEWLAYAKNPMMVDCPIRNMNPLDEAHYRQRILTYHRIAEHIDNHDYSDLSELHAMEQKYAVIHNDFDDFYRRMTPSMERVEVYEPVKTVLKNG